MNVNMMSQRPVCYMAGELDESAPNVLLVNRAVIINKLKILLIKRIASDRSNPSLWEIPGGKLAIGEDLHKSLEREILEETGLLIEPISRLAYYKSEIAGPNGPKKYVGRTFVKIVALAKDTQNNLRLIIKYHPTLRFT